MATAFLWTFKGRARATANTKSWCNTCGEASSGKEYFNSNFQPNQLNIAVEQPALVYPGQLADIRIAVTDQSGKPVPDVDLTAYSLTKKFEYGSAEIAGLISLNTRNRKLINKFF